MKYLEILYRNGEKDLINLATVSYILMRNTPDGKKVLEVMYPEYITLTVSQTAIRHGGVIPHRQYAVVGITLTDRLAEEGYKAILELLSSEKGLISIKEEGIREEAPPLRPAPMLEEKTTPPPRSVGFP